MYCYLKIKDILLKTTYQNITTNQDNFFHYFHKVFKKFVKFFRSKTRKPKSLVVNLPCLPGPWLRRGGRARRVGGRGCR